MSGQGVQFRMNSIFELAEKIVKLAENDQTSAVSISLLFKKQLYFAIMAEALLQDLFFCIGLVINVKISAMYVFF